MKQILTIAALIALPLSSSHAALVYAMDFENSPLGGLDGGTLDPSSSSGYTGSATVVGTGSSIVAVGDVSTFCGTLNMGQAVDLADGSWLNTGVNLGTGLGIDATTPYTMAAWINYPSSPAGADRFVFGTDGNRLHLGIRDESYHSGHWSDDVGPSGTTVDDAWHYVVWTNNAAGEQEIFVDGASVAGPGAAGGTNNFAGTFIIGSARTNNNGGARDFIGQIAGLQVYDTVLSVDQQKAIAGQVAIPEPSRSVLLGLAVLGLMLRRRR